MKHSVLATAVGSFFLLLACAPVQVANDIENGQWEATLTSQVGIAGVSGNVTASSMERGTSASIRIEDGEPGAVYPWFIHRGGCADDGDLVGEPESYPLLQIDDDGRGDATALIDTRLEPGEEYSVHVHQSPEEMRMVVSCGELQRHGDMQMLPGGPR